MVDVTINSVVDLMTNVFVLSTMFSIGLELTVSQIVAPLRQRPLMSKALLVNVMLVPLLAITLIISVSIEPGYATGLLIIAIAPGAPFGPKLAEIAEGDVPFATSLMAILTVVSVVTIPVTVALFLPSGVSVNPLGIARHSLSL